VGDDFAVPADHKRYLIFCVCLKGLLAREESGGKRSLLACGVVLNNGGPTAACNICENDAQVPTIRGHERYWGSKIVVG
jgi:hypothetical protein